MPSSNSWVTNAEIDGNYIVLTVQVDTFADGETVEVSGCATQAYETPSDGGFATFSEIKKIEITDKSTSTAELKIKAKMTKDFQQGQDVTVVVRVAKVWISVLSDAGSQPRTGQGWAWQLKGVGGPDEYPSDQGSDGQPAADAPPSALAR